MRVWVLVNRDVIDIVETDVSHVEAIADCLAWKTRPVLDAAKSLFLGRSDQLSVNRQAR